MNNFLHYIKLNSSYFHLQNNLMNHLLNLNFHYLNNFFYINQIHHMIFHHLNIIPYFCIFHLILLLYFLILYLQFLLFLLKSVLLFQFYILNLNLKIHHRYLKKNHLNQIYLIGRKLVLFLFPNFYYLLYNIFLLLISLNQIFHILCMILFYPLNILYILK